MPINHGGPWPLTNVWLGVTAENQAATKRLDDLAATPAAVRFVNYEPALEAVDFSRWVYDREEKIRKAMYGPAALNEEQAGSVIPRPIDWVIAGGESGSNARYCDAQWVRDVVKQCRVAGTPVFVKQLGSNTGGTPKRLLHRKGADPSEWPADLRVRQYPEVKR